jgi:hypothetical protein
VERESREGFHVRYVPTANMSKCCRKEQFSFFHNQPNQVISIIDFPVHICDNCKPSPTVLSICHAKQFVANMQCVVSLSKFLIQQPIK